MLLPLLRFTCAALLVLLVVPRRTCVEVVPEGAAVLLEAVLLVAVPVEREAVEVVVL